MNCFGFQTNRGLFVKVSMSYLGNCQDTEISYIGIPLWDSPEGNRTGFCGTNPSYDCFVYNASAYADYEFTLTTPEIFSGKTCNCTTPETGKSE